MSMRDTPVGRYGLRTLGFMGAYLGVNVAAMTGAFDGVRAPGSWALALAVAAPVSGHVWATLAMMSESDEFVRAVTAKRFIVAAGLAMALFSAWGFAETYAAAPHVPGWLVYPLFWAVFGVTAPFIRTSR